MKSPITRLILASVAAALPLLTVSALAAPPDPAPSPPSTIRIGITTGTWAGIREADANAAIQAWATSILRQHGTNARVENRFFNQHHELAAALEEGSIDAVSSVTAALLALDPRLQPDHLFLATKNGSPSERYVAVVHRQADLANLRDLRGRHIAITQGPRMSLALPWLESLLADPSGDIPWDATRGLTTTESASRTVLRIFFRQSDACIVTSNTFALACELNPQLSRDLVVLAASPDVIPHVFFLRRSYTNALKASLESALEELHQTPAGRQVLSVFQCERMQRFPTTCLEPTQRLLTEHHRLKRVPATPLSDAAPARSTPRS